ncbi:hypothetical protein [Pedomonas sp. V897]|uniref:hypothetical protein n=1 Tax=Pedomonas sp. V897 TaxID=3446482 RepID=UPI003EE33ADA
MNRKLSKIATIFATTVAMSPAYASEAVTLETSVQPVFVNGKLQGCAFHFRSAKSEVQYRNGELTIADGSLNFYAFEGKVPAFVLKIGIIDPNKKTVTAPDTAYLINQLETNKSDLINSIDAEAKGFRMFSYEANGKTVDIITDASISGRLTIGYTLNGGQMASLLPIDMTMKNLDLNNPDNSTIDTNAPRRWLECIIQNMKNQMEYFNK